MRLLQKIERSQYRTDAKAIMCRGDLEAVDVARIKNGIMFENAMFYVSRGYVPTALFYLYRKGIFEESFSFGEFKYLAKIALAMHCIDLAGHCAFRAFTEPTLNKYMGQGDS